MSITRFPSVPVILLALTGLGFAQQNPPSDQPLPSVGNNRPKPGKESNTRTIEGIVKDAADNPIANAIVELKNTKTSKVVDFPTKDDGKFAFRDLAMDINYELLAKHGGTTTPVRKVSLFDTRKDVVVNFQFAADKSDK